MNQATELTVGCFGVVHVIELRDVYKTNVSVYKKGGTAMIRPLHSRMQRAFFVRNVLCVDFGESQKYKCDWRRKCLNTQS